MSKGQREPKDRMVCRACGGHHGIAQCKSILAVKKVLKATDQELAGVWAERRTLRSETTKLAEELAEARQTIRAGEDNLSLRTRLVFSLLDLAEIQRAILNGRK